MRKDKADNWNGNTKGWRKYEPKAEEPIQSYIDEHGRLVQVYAPRRADGESPSRRLGVLSENGTRKIGTGIGL